ncbi:MAG: hypothetical protein ACTSRG_22410 [Candidatus Helarchaeota archaeon]
MKSKKKKRKTKKTKKIEEHVEDPLKSEVGDIPNTFQQILDSKDIGFFINLFDSGDKNSRAWGFLGIFRLIAHKKVNEIEKLISKTELQRIILELLEDKREIGGVTGTRIRGKMNLSELNIDKIALLDKEIILKPVFEYIMSDKTKTDRVAGYLLEHIVSKVPDPHTEPLILKHALRTGTSDFELKNHIVKAIENIQKAGRISEKKKFISVLKDYLKDIKKDKTEFEKIKGETESEFYNRTSFISKIKLELRNNIEHVSDLLKKK